MNISEMLTSGGQAVEIAEIERLGKNMWARQKWAKFSPLQRCRIELGYAAAKAVESNIAANPEETLRFWLSPHDEGESSFEGVMMEVQKDGEVTTIQVTDGRQEFLTRYEDGGLNITGVADLGKAKLTGDDED